MLGFRRDFHFEDGVSQFCYVEVNIFTLFLFMRSVCRERFRPCEGIQSAYPRVHTSPPGPRMTRCGRYRVRTRSRVTLSTSRGCRARGRVRHQRGLARDRQLGRDNARSPSHRRRRTPRHGDDGDVRRLLRGRSRRQNCRFLVSE